MSRQNGRQPWDSIERILVTPGQAREWLFDHEGKPHHNFRKVKSRLVDEIVRAMVDGDYVDNGDPIRIDPQDRCVDGQHRLHAIVKADRPEYMTVMFGFTGRIEMIDTNRSVRQLHDILASEGQLAAVVVAAVVRVDYAFTAAAEEGVSVITTFQRHVRLDELVDHWRRHRDAFDAARLPAQASRMMIPASWGGALWLQFRELDPEMADTFFDALAMHGLSRLREDDPMHILLRLMLNDAKKSERSMMSTTYKAAVVIKVWNLWRTGRNVRNLGWRSTGPGAEPFPTIL